MTKKKKAKRDFTPTKRAKALTDMGSETDYFGSYTGRSDDPDDVPVQDADDL